MKISFSPPDVGIMEAEQVKEALISGWITTGPKTKELERQVATFCGVNRAACLGSQTACAEMTLHLLGIKNNDEVFCSDMTFDATLNPVVYEGGIPIFIDTERDSWNIPTRCHERQQETL